jgi:integrase/recombinase XerD
LLRGTLHSFNVSFYIRRNKNKRKDYNIYCCIKVYDDRPKELCIMGSIKREDWDMGKGMPKQSNDYLIKLSLYLDAIKAKLFNIDLDLKLKGENVSARGVKNV